MRAFVAGATGLTGRSVVESAIAAGIEPIAHVRPDSSRLDHWRRHFGELGATVDTTAWTPDAMADAMSRHRPDIAFGLLGTTRKRSKAGDGDYRTVDFGLTVMLIDALVAAGLEETRFVYLSSLGADGGSGAYMAARKDAEAHLKASGLPYTIARPSFIVGQRDEHRSGEAIGATIADAALGLVGLVARRMADRYRSIDGRVLATGLVRAAIDPAAVGQVLDSADLR